MNRRFLAALAATFAITGAVLGQVVYSNNSTNYNVTVYGPGDATAGFLIITNSSTLTLRIRIANNGTVPVVCIPARTSTTVPTVNTNAVQGIMVQPAETKTIEEWPVICTRAWSCITTNAGSTNTAVTVIIDRP
jgi:hypothetical protein